MEQYPILQSGFVCLTPYGVKRPDPIEPSFRREVLFKDLKDPLNKFFYSPEITDLYLRWADRPEALREFEFRERLLVAAMSIFAGGFYPWLNFQNNAETVGHLHASFIVETLEYLLADKPRSVQCIQWINLLEADKRSSKTRMEVGHYFRDENNSSNSFLKLPCGIKDIVTLWTQKVNGFEDLLITLFVIYGERSGRTDITNLAY